MTDVLDQMKQRIETNDNAIRAVGVLLTALGEDITRDGLQDTPRRVYKALVEMTEGYRMDPAEILAKRFQAGNIDEIIAVKNIDFTSLCEHHLLPFVGVAHVAYIPAKGAEAVVGLSKIARLVECFARRLQIQERMTQEIATTLLQNLDARGVGVVVTAKHLCMGCRGVRKPSAEMVTSCTLGIMRTDARTRAEFFNLIAR